MSIESQKQVVSKSLSWIENNLRDIISVADLSEKFGYSKWHFQKIFLQITGVTVGKYIRMRRLSRAMKELKFTDKTVLEIAVEYQFGSNATFTRSFKKEMGMTPHEYRNGEYVFIQNYFPLINLDSPLKVHHPEFVTRESGYITGVIDEYKSDFGVKSDEYEQFTLKCWKHYLSKFNKRPDCSVTFLDSDKFNRHLVIRKNLGTFSMHPINSTSVKIPGGECCRFHFKGKGRLYFYYVLQAHNYVINILKLNKIGTEVIVKIVNVSIDNDDLDSSYIDVIIDIPVSRAWQLIHP